MPDPGKPDAEDTVQTLDEALEEGLEETFPASDPPAALRREPAEPPKPA
ncbi:MAG TPA: hypothetical protein PLO65_07995 [Caulobacter sp.]|nr:hypothetical protein [Caulobacter sp.]